MAEIILDGVEKRFADGTWAVRPTDLTIHDGELFILVGPSGCGKSTLLNLIVGLERPSRGEILVDGTPVTGRDPKDRNMAMVFQSYAIYPHMTVRENLAFPLRLARLDQAEIAARVDWAAETLELTGLLDRKPAALSGGQRQRVAMGRAIVRRPVAFLLDEPLSNLDAKLRAQMRVELARLQHRLGTTTVYVTHDQTEALTLGDRVALLRDGSVQQVGTPRALYERPANLFVAGFIGSPAINLVPARIRGDRLVLPMGELALPRRYRGCPPSDNGELVAGIRPEHISEVPADGDGPGAGTVFNAEVELVEWLGAERFVHVDLLVARGAEARFPAEESELAPHAAGPTRLTARIGGKSRAEEGSVVRLGLDPDGVLLFDARTGDRIPDSGDARADT